MAIPYVNIELGKEYKLRLGCRATVEFERETGIKIMKLDEDILTSMDILSKLLFKMIIRETDEDKSLTQEKIIDLIDEYAPDLMSVINKIIEAIQAAFPEPKNAHPPIVKK